MSTTRAARQCWPTRAAFGNIRDIEQADVIVLAGVDPAEEQPVLDLFIRRAVRRQGAKLVILHPRKIEDTRYPGVYVPYLPGQETACSTA